MKKLAILLMLWAFFITFDDKTTMYIEADYYEIADSYVHFWSIGEVIIVPPIVSIPAWKIKSIMRLK